MREYGRPTTTPTTARKSPIRKPGVLEPFDRGKQVKDHDRWKAVNPAMILIADRETQMLIS